MLSLPSSPADEAPRRNQSGQSLGRKGQEKRQRLIDAVATLLRERSLAELRIADIVRAAGTSAPNFYLYFSSVLDVVLAAVEQTTMADEALLAMLSQPWPPAEYAQRAQQFYQAYVAHWRSQACLLRARSVLVSEGEKRFIAAEEAASIPVMVALARQFDRAAWAAPAGPGGKALGTAGAFLAMLDRLAAYQPELDSPLSHQPTLVPDAAVALMGGGRLGAPPQPPALSAEPA